MTIGNLEIEGVEEASEAAVTITATGPGQAGRSVVVNKVASDDKAADATDDD